MNKKLLNVLAVSTVLLTTAAPLTPSVSQPSTVLAASKKQTNKTVKMAVYKYSKNHKSHAKSMARGFVGNKAQVTVKNGRVVKLTIHVDGKNSPMGKGQNVEKIVKSLKINGVKGKKAKVSKDNSSFDFVFSGKAFKNNGWTKMSVTINFGGNMTEQAWVKFGKVSGVKKVTSKKHKKSLKKTRSHKKVSKKSIRRHR